jgi:hypothetical protein
MTKLLEKDLERKVVAYAKSKGVLCYKFSSPGNRGVPDRILIGPTGRIAFLELKREGQKPTALQLHTIDKLRAQGCNAGWVDNLKSAKAIIDNLV